MWAGIAFLALALLGAGAAYLISKFSGFRWVAVLSKGRKGLRLFFGFLMVTVLFAVPAAISGFVNSIILLIHFTVFYLLSDLLFFFVRRIHGSAVPSGVIAGVAVTVSVLYLAAGWNNFRHVRRTAYRLETDKEIGSVLRVAQIADAHIGNGFGAEGFREHLERISEEHPDLLVITGDFCDESTTWEDFSACCEALKEIQTAYGVYYVFGNHDKGMDRRRGFGASEIIKELAGNHVHVLMDEAVPVGENVILIGRKDRSDRERKKLQQIPGAENTDQYRIVLDHQPNSYEEEAAFGADLVLSGHTHGGQFLPVIHAGEWLGANDRTYGHEKRGSTDFIVTSGIADWAIKVRTGCFSEYVIIDIVPQ